ncbi:MAG: proton-conducting transporter membrane subunit [Clostridiaceae bacterium]
MDGKLVFILTTVPIICAGISLLIKNNNVRKVLIALFAVIMFGASFEVIRMAVSGTGFFTWGAEGLLFDPAWILRILDIAILGYVIYTGVRLRHLLIVSLAAVQLIVLMIFEAFGKFSEPITVFKVDYLSAIMVLLVSIIGPMIAFFATGYMKKHEDHQQLKKTRLPGFFAIILVFLGAMNGLVMADDLMWMYFFWEVTTLCSFLLISHDRNEISIKNASRALWINLLGGLAFLFAIIAVQRQLGTLSISELVERSSVSGLTGLIPLAVVLFSIAGFTKAAQFPFQSWLLGAMVAPTPVSALLHSSTMVKAGVYLLVRLSPLLGGTLLGNVIAAVGGFSFLAGSALAVGQKNGKRVLAYSTIANLGLIICCAGIGTHVAIGAGMLLIIFHALSKSLLFLCIGTIEQQIGSRDIEDMQGLMKKMPFTTVITTLGMISMLLPPFGVLLTKWLAIEAAVRIPAVLVLIILGSAFTIVFWAKWIGIILTMSYKSKLKLEKMDFSMRSVLAALLALMLTVSVSITKIYNTFVLYQLSLWNFPGKDSMAGKLGSILATEGNGTLTGSFATMPFFIILLALTFLVAIFALRTRPENIKPPYVGGELANDDIRGIEFIGPKDRIEHAVVHNYYFSNVLQEKNMTHVMNMVAVAIILVMFGVVI